MKILHLISIELEWILFVALHQIEFMITKKKLLQTLCISYDCYLDFMRKNTYDEWRHLNEEKNTRRNGQTPHDLIDEFQIEWNNTHTYVYMWVRLYAVQLLLWLRNILRQIVVKVIFPHGYCIPFRQILSKYHLQLIDYYHKTDHLAIQLDQIRLVFCKVHTDTCMRIWYVDVFCVSQMAFVRAQYVVGCRLSHTLSIHIVCGVCSAWNFRLVCKRIQNI